MDDSLEILVTNDDGIGSAGLRALVDALDPHGHVTVVAPADDQSAVGRAMSNVVKVTEHELGYAVDGTPSDCVVAGIGDLVGDPDLVVSGCNKGANLGSYTLGRSGTVSAAVEASFFGVPAIAVSLYVPTSSAEYELRSLSEDDFEEAISAVDYLVSNLPREKCFEQIDYLNVNAPVPDEGPTRMELTRPSETYDMDATREGSSMRLQDRIWDRMNDGSIDEPPGTDRRAILDGNVSVSPLKVPHEPLSSDVIDDLIGSYPLATD